MSIRLPKMKFEPSLTKPRMATKPWLSQSNTWRPPGTSRTRAAKAICRMTPVDTSFQSTARRLLENSHTMPISTANPNRPKPIRPSASIMESPVNAVMIAEA